MAHLAPGSEIAGCRLEAVAGRGGMGVVWKATQIALARPVAVKAMMPELATDTEFRQRFQRESQLAASIDHPNVIPVYEAGESHETLYLIMRWVDGSDLRALLSQSGGLPVQRALTLLQPVALALAAAHRRGLIHRDVKPANVLIASEEGQEHVYLTDFGIARLESGEGLTRTGDVVGTLDYTAPERYSGSRGDAASDIYALGCMLYQTLTGKLPYDRPTDVSKIFAHINDPIPLPSAAASGVPADVDAIVTRAMAKDPADRYASATEMAVAIDDARRALSRRHGVVRHQPSSEPPPTAVPQATVARATVPQATAPPRAALETTADLASTPSSPATTLTRPTRAAPGRPRAPRRARLLGLAGLVTVGLIVAAVVIASGGSTPASRKSSGSTPGSRPSAANGEVTSSSGGIAASAPVKLAAPTGSISVDDSRNFVWVSLPTNSQLLRISTLTGSRRLFTVGGRPTGVASVPYGGGVWVIGSRFGSLALLSEQSAQLMTPTKLALMQIGLATEPLSQSAWTFNANGVVSHFDRAGSLVAQVAVTPPPLAIAAGEREAGWAVNGTSLVRVSPSQDNVARFDTGAGPVAVALDQGVWTAHSNGDVTRFNPRTLRVNAAPVQVGSALSLISAVEGAPSVWATSYSSRTIYRVSNTSQPGLEGQVTFRTPPIAIAADLGGVWVATADGYLVRLRG